jgi:hypothetical protein
MVNSACARGAETVVGAIRRCRVEGSRETPALREAKSLQNASTCRPWRASASQRQRPPNRRAEHLTSINPQRWLKAPHH